MFPFFQSPGALPGTAVTFHGECPGSYISQFPWDSGMHLISSHRLLYVEVPQELPSLICCGLIPAGNHVPPSHSHTPCPCSGIGRRIRKKPVSLEWFNKWNKVQHTTTNCSYKPQKTNTIQFLIAHWPMPSLSLSCGQPLPANSPQFICWAWHSVVWNVPVASLGQLSGPWSLPAFCPSPHWQSMRTLKSPWFRITPHSNNQNIGVLSTAFSS